MLHMKFGFDRPSVSEEKIFEIVDGRRTDGRRTDDGAWPSYKLTLWAFGSGELKIVDLDVKQYPNQTKPNQRSLS